jgi:hypothetical protein
VVEREAAPPQPPSRLQGTEPMYGWVVGLEILVVAVIVAFARHGVGAPKHYSTADTVLIAVGIVAALTYLALLRVRNRTVAAFGAIVAAYIPSLVPGPNWTRDVTEIGLLPPLIYAVVVAQRMRKATKLAMASGKAAGGPSTRTGAGRASGRSARERPAPRTRNRSKQAVASGPPRSARYTPPKPKRAPVKKAAEAASSRNQRRTQKSD